MNTIIKMFIAVFAFAVQLCTTAYAEQQAFCMPTLETSGVKTVVVYGNGVLNTRKQAGESLAALQERLRKILPAEKYATLDFKLAYNESVSAISDMREFWQQKFESDNYETDFWRMQSGRLAIPEKLRDDYKKRLASLDAWGPLAKIDIATHLNLYREIIREGKKAVAVVHSQGNPFANKAYEILYSGNDKLTTKSFGIVSIANPMSFVGGDGPYTTLRTDLVIEEVRAESPDNNLMPPLPWNTENYPTGWDPTGHSSIGEYLLEGSVSESKIIADILYVENHLTQPPALTEEKVISITLTSNPLQGMGLKVVEPSGAQVSDLSPVGTSGWFDMIDLMSSGVQRYVVPCSRLEEGGYSLLVAYTRGSGSNGMGFEIKAGTTVKSFTIPPYGPSASLEYNRYVPVGAIQVTRDLLSQGYYLSIISPFLDVVTNQIPTPRYGAF